MEAALDKGAPLDRDDPEDRAAADAHYEAVAPVWRGLAPKARLALVLPYVQSLGLLPKGLVRRLDAALRGTPADKHAAAGLIGAIARDAPAALADLRPGAVVQMIFTAGMIKAEEALQWGLVNRVVAQADLLAKCNELATAIMKNSPTTLAAAIRAVKAGCEPGANGMKCEIEEFGKCFGTADFKEGASAFMEKRKANFTGH